MNKRFDCLNVNLTEFYSLKISFNRNLTIDLNNNFSQMLTRQDEKCICFPVYHQISVFIWSGRFVGLLCLIVTCLLDSIYLLVLEHSVCGLVCSV